MKWRITGAYLVTVAIMSLILSYAYGDAGVPCETTVPAVHRKLNILSVLYGNRPCHYTVNRDIGQIIFGVGVAILTVLMITYLQFFGASFVALVIMNLTTPLLDRVGVHKPFGR